jgi:nucleoside-diphosphate-sugar epimerase
MKMLITGSSGFIGRWLVQSAKQAGFDVYGLDRFKAREIQQNYVGNLCEIGFLDAVLERVRPDIVVHLAARTDLGGRTCGDYVDNIDGVNLLLRSLKKYKSIKKAIFTSTQLVCKIGHVPNSPTEYCPNTAYGESKVIGEQLVRGADLGGIEWCIVRPTTVWGPGISTHYQRMIKMIEAGRYFHCGHELLYKSYGYCENVAEQYCRIASAPAGVINSQTLYLADYAPISLKTYADRIANELNAPKIPTLPMWAARSLAKLGDLAGCCGFANFPFNSFRLRNIRTEYVFDMQKTLKICGPMPVSFDEGIKRMINWYQASKSRSIK